MKKSVLREVIRNIVSNKLMEANGKYGYLVSGEDSNDPIVQVRGSTRMPLSQLKNYIEEDIKKLLGHVQNNDWKNAAALMEKDGVLYSRINAVKDVLSVDLTEIENVSMSQTDTSTDIKVNEPKVDPKLQKDIAAVQQNIDKITANIRKMDGEKSKLEEPVRQKIQKLDRNKASLQKKQGNEIEKLEKLKAK